MGGKNPIQMQNFPARSHKYLKLHMNRAQGHPHGRPLKIAQNYRIAVVCAMKIDLSRTQHLRSRIQHKFSFTAFSEAAAAALFFLLYIWGGGKLFCTQHKLQFYTETTGL